MSKKRLKDFPDVPTTYELGYKVATTTTRGYAVRAGTPPERVKALSDALTKAMKHSTFATYLKGSGLNPDDSVAASAEWTEQLQEEYRESCIRADRAWYCEEEIARPQDERSNAFIRRRNGAAQLRFPIRVIFWFPWCCLPAPDTFIT